MEIKTLELRDRATFIPILAIKPGPRCEEERYLWARAGYGRDPETQSCLVLMSTLDCGGIEYSPGAWCDRTFSNAHEYIMNNWDNIDNGQVIDVEYILGETTEPKESERTCPL